MIKISKIIVFLFGCTFSFYAVAQPGFLGIDCGGQSRFETRYGEIYLPDVQYSQATGYGFTGGHREERLLTDNNYDIEGALALLRWRREGDFNYRFDVEPGSYLVKLRLNELDYHGAGFRTFSVAIEGDTVLRNIDLFAEIGRAYGMIFRFPVDCDDESINIRFIPGSDDATCCSIGIQQIEEDEQAPPDINNLAAIGSYNMNILYWDRNPAIDLHGFRIYRRRNGGQWELITPVPHPVERYRDYDVHPGSSYQYRVAAVDAWGNVTQYSQSITVTTLEHSDSNLPVVSIDIDPQQLHQMNEDVWSDTYHTADVIFSGNNFADSGLRYRGAWTRTKSKKSYKIRFPGNTTYRGRGRLNLVAQMPDITMMREYIAEQVFQLIGCYAPEVDYVHLALNGLYMGVYTDNEPVKNAYLMQRGLSPEGNLYKAYANLSIQENEQDYQIFYEKENNSAGDWDDLIEFIEWLNLSLDEEFEAEAGEHIELDDFLDVYTANVATANLDFSSSNYCIYHNPVSDRWHYIPYDIDNTFRIPTVPIDVNTVENPNPLVDEANILINRVLHTPLFKYAYTRKLERFIKNQFIPENIIPLIQNTYDYIEFDATRDIHTLERELSIEFETGPDRFETFLEDRIEYINDTIPQFLPDINLAEYFRFNEIQPVNRSVIADESGDFDPWVEIVNLAPVELDLEGFELRWGQSSWILPSDAVIDDRGFLLLWLDGEQDDGALHSTFAFRQGVSELRLISPEGTISDIANPDGIESDAVFARDEDGIGEWTSDLTPTPGITNTPTWNVSDLLINEFLAHNLSSNPDEHGEYDDWVEIHNPTPVNVNLNGTYLTDDIENPDRWLLPDTTITSGGYIIIWCDNDTEQGILHAPFRLNGEGEHIGFFESDGHTPIDMIVFYDQQEDMSFGRHPDTPDEWGYMQPTPGEENRPFVEVDERGAEALLPSAYSFDSVAPNPFNSVTMLRFSLPSPANVRIEIFDILGRQIVTPFNGHLSAGQHKIPFYGDDFASGIYFCKLIADKQYVVVRKMALIR
ncbi:MAG: CotH kinase family protein [Candidatus Electryonea clarkiae]|nr:CotH kinase family protein [Candidatus Electryonea clarkiae]MDP8286813.1 CotH kinase family protein [Candidatus Electryonea clarkiae]